MQKHLKNIIPYHFLIFVLLFLFTQCQESEVKEEKIDYPINLKYFPNKSVAKRFISEDNKKGIYIALPQCFKKDYSLISVTNKHNFYCTEKEVYFTIDLIPKKDIHYYKSYFSDNLILNQDDTNILLDYVISTRHKGLIDAKKSIYTKITSDKSKTILLGSTKGYSNQYSNELLHQFGVIAAGDNYYVLQCVMSVNNAIYLHSDAIEIFKSFSLN